MHSLAIARRMAGRKKGEATQLQLEVCTEEEWNKLLAKEGLVVVDVYSGWCGPCVGMLGNLKKIKLEIGGDLLHLAIAKADGIEALTRFRNKSEPTWMFIGSGHLVNLMFGANAPRLCRMIIDELAKETEVLKGDREREIIPFHELTPEEKERQAEEERRRLEAIAAEEEATAAKLNALRLMSLARRDVEPLHLVLLPPHVVTAGPETGAWLEVTQILSSCEALVLEEHQVELQPESASAALELGAEGSEARREWCIALQTGPCVALLVGAQPEEEEEVGEVEKQPETHGDDVVKLTLAEKLSNALGPTDPVQAVETAPESVSAKYRDGMHVPGAWAPCEPDRRSSAVALLFPELAGPTPEETDGGVEAPVEVTVAVFLAEQQQIVLETLQQNSSERMLAVALRQVTEKEASQLAGEDNSELALNLSGERLVVALRTDGDQDALTSLSSLEPIYLSEDAARGVIDFQLLFPASDDNEEANEQNGDEETTQQGSTES